MQNVTEDATVLNFNRPLVDIISAVHRFSTGTVEKLIAMDFRRNIFFRLMGVLKEKLWN
jgi:hypothetical protein